MKSRSRIASTNTPFSPREYETLRALRAKYEAGQHLFTEHELARLRFVRWLIHSPGWNRALDQPVTAQQRTSTAQQSLTWMPGYIV